MIPGWIGETLLSIPNICECVIISNRRDFLKVAGGSAVLTGLSGCVGDVGGGGGDESLDQVGMTAYVRGGSWITAYIEAAEFYAEDQGIDLEVRPNQQSAQKQVQDIRDFANQGYDGILVGVWQTGAAESAINSAIDQGVPVFATNADTSSEEIPLYVGFSNYDGGATSAEEMVTALEEARPNKDQWNVLDIRGPQGNQSANQRSQGFLDVMADQERVNVTDTLNGEFAQDQAQSIVQEYINATGVPDGIYSGNLSMGLGVVQALQNLDLMVPKGEEGHIVLTQMDGSPQVNPLVGDGLIDAAVDQPNYFYNPLALYFMREYVESGQSDDSIPEVGSEVSADQVDIESAQHKGVNMWSEPIWAPSNMDEQNGHPWLKTNITVITQENYDAPYLWGNIWD